MEKQGKSNNSLLSLEQGVKLGVGIAGASIAAAVAATKGLNDVTGKNRQPGDRGKVASAFAFSSSNYSSGTILQLLGKGDESGNEDMSNTMLELFREHDDYKEERVRGFIQKLHTKNPECGIRHGKWNNPLHMDIFQAFGAPGHSGVHGGLLIAYPGFDKWFITISIDLQALSKDILENAKIPENFGECDKSSMGGNLSAVKHTLDVVDGIENVWEYKKSVSISLLELFGTVAKAMVAGNKRLQTYDMFKSNCIHFKNDILNILEALEDKKPWSQKFPFKTNVTKFSLNVNKDE